MKCKIEFSKTLCNFHYNYEPFIKSAKHHIISLEFDDQQSCIDEFMNSFPIDSLFSRLESIILNSISLQTFSILLFYLKSLPCLSSLSVCLTDCSYDIGIIYQMIFYLSLNYFRIAAPKHEHLCVTIPIAAENQFSSIKYLIIYHRCTLNQLIQILSHTPCIHHLHCFQIVESYNNNVKSKLTIKLHNLTYLAMTLYDIEFDEFEECLLQLCSQLEFLGFQIRSMDKSYLDTNRWEELISKKIISLTKFNFRYHDTIDDDFIIDSYYSLINRFTSSFWIDRQWIFKLLIEDDDLICSIRPYKYVSSRDIHQSQLTGY